VVFVKEGRLYQGAYAELLAASEPFSDLISHHHDDTMGADDGAITATSTVDPLGPGGTHHASVPEQQTMIHGPTAPFEGGAAGRQTGALPPAGKPGGHSTPAVTLANHSAAGSQGSDTQDVANDAGGTAQPVASTGATTNVEGALPLDDESLPAAGHADAMPLAGAEKGAKLSAAGTILVAAESMEQGSVSWRSYRDYARAGGGLWLAFLVLLLFFVAMGVKAFSDW